jgi:hypothetical protein
LESSGSRIEVKYSFKISRGSFEPRQDATFKTSY